MKRAEQTINVIDIRNKWALVVPHLTNAQVARALEAGMNGYLGQWHSHDADGSEGRRSQNQYDPNRGPWSYSPNWLSKIRRQVEEAIDRGEFKWGYSYGEEPTLEDKARLRDFTKRFVPKPGTLGWYQCPEAAGFLAPWELQLARSICSGLDWRLTSQGELPLVYGTDKDGNIASFFSILNYKCPPCELFHHATHKDVNICNACAERESAMEALKELVIAE
jgi:hypothetical protein